MEEPALYKAFMHSANFVAMCFVDFAGPQLGDTAPDFMFCPSSPRPSKYHESQRTALRNLAKSNYSVAIGDSTYLHSIEHNDFIDQRIAKESGPSFEAKTSYGIMTIRMIPGWVTHASDRDSSSGLWKYGFGKGVEEGPGNGRHVAYSPTERSPSIRHRQTNFR